MDMDMEQAIRDEKEMSARDKDRARVLGCVDELQERTKS